MLEIILEFFLRYSIKSNQKKYFSFKVKEAVNIHFALIKIIYQVKKPVINKKVNCKS